MQHLNIFYYGIYKKRTSHITIKIQRTQKDAPLIFGVII